MSTPNTVIQNILERRSIRKFTDEPITREDLTTILEAGRWAPSGLNNQPWKLLVISDAERKERMAEHTKYGQVVKSAQKLICLFLEKDQIYSEMKDHQAAGACLQNMMLAAHSLGLGTVWLGEIINQEEQVLETLGLDNTKYELQAVLALGHPNQKGSSSRKELSEIMLEDY